MRQRSRAVGRAARSVSGRGERRPLLMRLIGEARIRDLLPAGSPGRLEASGVIFLGDRQAALVGAAGPGALDAAGPGALDAAGPRAVEAAGPRGLDAAGPGAVDAAGPRALDAAGPATVDGAGRADLGGEGRAAADGAGQAHLGGAGLVGDGRYLVIFDNLRAVARIGS